MPSTVAIIGGGVIGAGWAARFLLHGWNVRLFDPEPTARANVATVLERARLALPGLGEVALPDEGVLSFPGLMSEAVCGVDWVQESIPERLELKQKVFQALQENMDYGAILASSTSGFTPSELQATSTQPDQIVVTHPFNPVYLLPLVELVGSDRNGAARMARAEEVLTSIGMYPLRLRSEVPAHIAGRLSDAVWREALWLIRDGHASSADVDETIRMGLGPRWAQMGLFEAARLASPGAGATGALAPSATLPDTDLTLMRHISDETAEVADVAALEQQRDRNLVGVLRALAEEDWGAGAVLRGHDVTLAERRGLPATFEDIADLSQPIVTIERAVPLDWIDHNDHMTLAAYMQVFSDSIVKLLALIGCDRAYAQNQRRGFFTVDSRIRHRAEARAGAPLRVEVRVIVGEGKRLSLSQQLFSGPLLLARAEHALLHVDLDSRRSCPMDAVLASRLARIVTAQGAQSMPDGLED